MERGEDPMPRDSAPADLRNALEHLDEADFYGGADCRSGPAVAWFSALSKLTSLSAAPHPPRWLQGCTRPEPIGAVRPQRLRTGVSWLQAWGRRGDDKGVSVWVSSVAVPVGVSLLTVLVTGLTVGPRLTARGKRVQAAHDGRDQFNEKVLDLLALCANLEGLTDPASISEGLQGERDRWVEQVGEITAWLADHWQRFALTYISMAGLRDLVAQYAGAVRGVWLSGRSLTERVQLVKDLTGPVQTLYFASRWRVLGNIVHEKARLEKMLDKVRNGAGLGNSSQARAVTQEELRLVVDLVGVYHDEAVRCAEAECFRAGCVMIAAALEAGLLALVWAWEVDLKAQGAWPLESEKDPEKGRKKEAPEKWGLAALVKVARRAGWLPAEIGEHPPGDALTESEVDKLLGFVSEVRNMAAHPGKYVRKSREMPGVGVSGDVYETAYQIVRASFDRTYEIVLKAASQDESSGVTG